MKNNQENRRHLRKCALQAIVSMEFGQDPLQAAQFSYLYEKEDVEGVEIPLYLLQLVTGVAEKKEELDQSLSQYLKAGWTLDRLTYIDKGLLRLGLYEIAYYNETPAKVAINEAIELAKDFSDEKTAKFINGILTHFVTE